MTRRVARLLSMLGLLLAAVSAPPAVVAGDPCFRSTSRPAPTTGSTVEIAIGDCVFVPTVSYVAVGATVEWKNTSFQPHEVVGANLTWGAHEKLLNTGDAIGWTFDEPGVFAYSCMLHPGMSGAIVVGEPTAATDTDALAVTGSATTANMPAANGGAGTPDPGPTIAAIGAAALVLGAFAVGYVRRRRQAPAS